MTITKVSGELDRSEAKAASLLTTLRLQRELTADNAELDRRHYEELTNARAENDRLAADVAAGKRRLLIKAACPAHRVPAATAAPGLDDAETAELDPSARQDYYALRDQITVTEKALSGLQEYVERVCSK